MSAPRRPATPAASGRGKVLRRGVPDDRTVDDPTPSPRAANGRTGGPGADGSAADGRRGAVERAATAGPAAGGRRPGRPGSSRLPAGGTPAGSSRRLPAPGSPRTGVVPRVGSAPSSRGSAARPGATRPRSRSSSAAGPARPAAGVERVQLRVPRLFTVRVLVFGIVLLLAFVLVYPTLHSYLGQQVALERLRGQVAEAQQRNADLEADLERWDDPAYVTAQARERLSFVMPGETAFRVVDPETVPDAPPVQDDGPTTGLDEGSTLPWYATLWESVQVAGDTAAPDAGPADDTPAPTSTDAPADGTAPAGDEAPVGDAPAEGSTEPGADPGAEGGAAG